MKRIFGSFDSFWSCAETASHAILSPSLCQQVNSIFAASSKWRMTQYPWRGFFQQLLGKAEEIRNRARADE
jgi:hypothetical protein